MDERIATGSDLQAIADRGEAGLYPPRLRIAVGMATCGVAAGAQLVYDAILEEAANQKLDATISRTGCIGFCQQEPLVDIRTPGRPRITYGQMTPDKARQLIADLAKGNGSHEDWALFRTDEDELVVSNRNIQLATDPEPNGFGKIVPYQEHPFFKKQRRIILRNCGLIDAEDIEQYIARGGYRALFKALFDMTPEQVIEEVLGSGLRGRGGAGFPTGKKWHFCRQSPGETKYIICNADEGDPGAYMDRSILEGDPHSVLEGMAIGAYAIGANEGYLYVRAEYPLAIERLETAIAQAEKRGLIGENIFGSGFNLKMHIIEGAGAFVCGEETSLIASIEGRVGEPRTRPPFPAQKGLWDKPTNINNVKTWATIAPIVARGADWYAVTGTEGNRGTTVFSLVGNVNNNGLAEVPLGISLREMVFDIGAGLQGDKQFKAVQTGGPSGGCIPESLIDLPLDYESLREVGAMMGSGGMIVMDERTCMVDVARFFLEFTTAESCGKCTPCREGTKRMLQILTKIVQGQGQMEDIERLEKLGQVIKDTSLCALGATAPNPVLTTIQHFRSEYEAHVCDRRCPGRVCRSLISYRIDEQACTGCMACIKQCPSEAILGEKKTPARIVADKCIKCGACVEVCKFDAVRVQ